jgi:hypothetical protein
VSNGRKPVGWPSPGRQISVLAAGADMAAVEVRDVCEGTWEDALHAAGGAEHIIDCLGVQPISELLHSMLASHCAPPCHIQKYKPYDLQELKDASECVGIVVYTCWDYRDGNGEGGAGGKLRKQLMHLGIVVAYDDEETFRVQYEDDFDEGILQTISRAQLQKASHV